MGREAFRRMPVLPPNRPAIPFSAVLRDGSAGGDGMAEESATGRVDVVQDGARLHYALPVALRRAGLLGRVFTDWFVREGSLERRIAGFVGRLHRPTGARLAERACAELDGARIATSPLMALRHGLGTRLGASRPAAYEAESAANARRIIRAGLSREGALAGFSRNLHPMLAAAAERACGRLVLDQMIAPAVVEARALKSAARLWPGWADEAAMGEDAIARRMEEGAWPHAARVTCPSPYVRDALVAQGLDADKLVLAPYPIDARGRAAADRSRRAGPPVVGFVGSVGLRKGAPILAEIARRLRREARFVMVGPVENRAAAQALDAAGVTLTGPVSRSAVAGRLAECDLFLFPSFCEGSAGSIMEAMAAGLPVVATPSSGTVARDGIEGFLREVEDVDGLSHCVARLVGDADLRLRMGRAARARALAFDLDRYADDLAALYAGLGLRSPHRAGDDAQERAVEGAAPA